MRLRLVLVLSAALAAAAPAAAGAQPATPLTKLNDAELGTYHAEKGKETPASAGRRFLDDLSARDAVIASNVEHAVRYQIHAEEAAIFARQQRYVIVAYAVMWAILLAATAAMYLRQRRLAAALADLEARLAAKAKEAGRAG